MRRFFCVILAAAVLACAGWAGPPAAAAGKKLVAITYDDGPGPYTERLLDGLQARGVKATFFMLGSNAARYESTVARVYREGHQVANHSYDHPELTALSYSGVRSQMDSTNAVLDKACGRGTKYLVRPPYGSLNSYTAQAVGAPLIMWSVDPLDWKYRDAWTVRSNILSNAHDGAVILVHDIHSTTVDGSLAAIDEMLSQGYEFVTVNELFRRRGRTLEDGQSYYSSSPNGVDLGPVQAPSVSTQVEGGKIRVSITAQSGAGIWYSTDGSPLNQESKRYTGPFLVDAPCTIRAVAAFTMNGSRSGLAECRVDKPVAPAPQLHVRDGMLVIDGNAPGTTVTYSLSGATYSGGNQVYTGAVPIGPGTVISAYSTGAGYLTSSRVQACYSERGNFFLDVFPEDWFYPGMDRAAAAGYIYGVGGGRYAPNGQVTRGQLVTFLYRVAGEQATEADMAGMAFEDVPAGEYYTGAVAWAHGRGIVSGVDGKAFQPDRAVTRQEMGQIVYKYLAYRGIHYVEGDTLGQYADAGDVADWAWTAMGQLTTLGLFQGDGKGNCQPLRACSRAEAVAVLIRAADYMEAHLVEPEEPDVPSELENPGEPGQPAAPDVPGQEAGVLAA